MSQRWKTLMFLVCIAASHGANAAWIPETNIWDTPFGAFQVTNSIGGGGSNAILATYNVDSEIFQLTGNYLPGFPTAQPPQNGGNVVFSLAAFVSRYTGEFRSGAFSMIVGPAGLTGLGLSPGSLLLSGSILDLETGYTPFNCGAIGGICWRSDSGGRTPALLSLNFSAPELNLTTNFLTMTPYLLYSLSVAEPWSYSFQTTAPLGWQLNNTVPIAEPGTIALVGLALAGIWFSRRKEA